MKKINSFTLQDVGKPQPQPPPNNARKPLFPSVPKVNVPNEFRLPISQPVQSQSQPVLVQPRNWNVSISSYQRSTASSTKPVCYVYSKPRQNQYWYSSYVSSAGTRTVNTNNISISIH